MQNHHVMLRGASRIGLSQKRTSPMMSAFDLTNPVLPNYYDIDQTFGPIQMSAFGNWQYADCVIAARANQTLRAWYAPGMQISDEDVIDEYRREYEAENDGVFDPQGELRPFDSLSRWKTEGWTAAGVADRTIADFHTIDAANRIAIQKAIFVDMGVQIMFALPDGLNQLGNYGPGHLWNDTAPEADGAGHQVLLTAYNNSGVRAVTWGVYQDITWAWMTKYALAAYVVITSETALQSATFKLKMSSKRQTENSR